jgi:hypothetical protein
MGLPPGDTDPYLEGIPADWQPEEAEGGEEAGELAELSGARASLAAYTAAQASAAAQDEQLPCEPTRPIST